MGILLGRDVCLGRESVEGSSFHAQCAMANDNKPQKDRAAEAARDKKVKEIALEVPYPRMSEETVRRIREIVEEHQGEIPLSVTIVELPQVLADTSNRGEVRLKINQHFRVQPGAALSAKLQQVHATARYVF